MRRRALRDWGSACSPPAPLLPLLLLPPPLSPPLSDRRGRDQLKLRLCVLESSLCVCVCVPRAVPVFLQAGELCRAGDLPTAPAPLVLLDQCMPLAGVEVGFAFVVVWPQACDTNLLRGEFVVIIVVGVIVVVVIVLVVMVVG